MKVQKHTNDPNSITPSRCPTRLRRLAAAFAAAALTLALPGLASSTYIGVYSGNFSGGDNGIFSTLVSDDGTCAAMWYSESYNDGFYSTYSLNQNGGFSFSANGATVNGSITGNSMSGSYSSGQGAGGFSGTKHSATGIQQADAGLYEGFISGSASGTVEIIVAADGALAFYDAAGGRVDGGTGTINSAGQFSATSINGVAVSGSVNSTAHVITGHWNGGGGSGTFNASRTETVAGSSTPWPDASDLGGGWKRSSWFGDFNVNLYPWIYHAQHGWMYTFGTDPTSIWFWTSDLGPKQAN